MPRSATLLAHFPWQFPHVDGMARQHGMRLDQAAKVVGSPTNPVCDHVGIEQRVVRCVDLNEREMRGVVPQTRFWRACTLWIETPALNQSLIRPAAGSELHVLHLCRQWSSLGK